MNVRGRRWVPTWDELRAGVREAPTLLLVADRGRPPDSILRITIPGGRPRSRVTEPGEEPGAMIGRRLPAAAIAAVVVVVLTLAINGAGAPHRPPVDWTFVISAWSVGLILALGALQRPGYSPMFWILFAFAVFPGVIDNRPDASLWALVILFAPRRPRPASTVLAVPILIAGAAYLPWWWGEKWSTLGTLHPSAATSFSDARQLLAVWFLTWLMATAATAAVRSSREAAAAEAKAVEGVAAERARIARELHDVVAHQMSVVVIQAQAAQAASPDKGPDIARTIEHTARDALVELRRMLGVLRDDGAGDERSPQPTLEGLQPIVEAAGSGGVTVQLHVAALPDLPPALAVTAFRIVQEAVTNVVKHASPTTAIVEIGADGDRLDILIMDEGGSGHGITGGGHGLVGMSERVALYEGTLEAGPRTDSPGWQVHATLPLGPP